MKKINFRFQCVTWKLEKALGNFPYDHFDISEEVQEQVCVELCLLSFPVVLVLLLFPPLIFLTFSRLNWSEHS